MGDFKMQFATSAGTNGKPTFALEGDIFEGVDDDLDRLAAAAQAPEVVLDLRGIKRFNSLGVKSWIKFVAKLGKGRTYSLVNCPVIFIAYCNMMHHLVGSRQVQSFFVPYFCKPCAKKGESLVQRSAVANGDLGNPACSKCGKEALLEVEAEDYLAFLNA